ncbi:helix-turn-helix domain-containing protein [Saezia sanguinis]|uniref:helix-turn-helix domain-containing protein n=1 Tax=Saezia sanguinis TaxID=1965230 RepID=UPI0013A63BF4|nr:helix-turn-helix domain-containing protein [Saezia sanguinis]
MELQYNDRGYRIGQSHHKARLTDRDVELIFELREQGMTIVSIAERMECGRTTVWKILHGEIRSQPVVKSRCVHVLPWAM